MQDQDALGQAWAGFTEVMDNAREKIAGTPRFQDSEACRVRAYRNLMEVQAMTYNFTIAPMVNMPRTFVHTGYQTDVYTLGLACSDFFQAIAFLDGRRRYRMTGRLGKLVWMTAQVQTHILGHPDSRNLGDIDFRSFNLGPDGSFDVILSGEDEPGDHIKLDPASNYHFLWIRRALADWGDDTGELHLECLNDEPRISDLPADQFVERMAYAGYFAKHLLENWSIGMFDGFAKNAGGMNRINYLGGAALTDNDAGSPTTLYGAFAFEIGADEALIIDGPVPDTEYWGLQVGSVWGNGLDYVNHQADINMQRMVVDGDGRYRAVLSMRDPGVANWLDSVGNTKGIGMLRIVNTRKQIALPEIRLVMLADLRKELPADTRYVSADERTAALRHRERSIRTLFGQ